MIVIARQLKAHPSVAGNSGLQGPTLWAHIKVCFAIGGQQRVPTCSPSILLRYNCEASSIVAH